MSERAPKARYGSGTAARTKSFCYTLGLFYLGTASKPESTSMNNTQLKILAIISMTIDHVGAYLFPHVSILRHVGRLAFPLFSYLVCEGCMHTHNKARYLANMCAFGAVSQLVLSVGRGDLLLNIFCTLALSVVTVYALQWWAPSQNDPDRRWLSPRILAPVAAIALDVFCCQALPGLVGHGLHVQYGIVGVLLPVFAYLPYMLGLDKDDRSENVPYVQSSGHIASVALFGIGLIALSIALNSSSQWWGLLSLVPLAAYNGERGGLGRASAGLKYFFYAYYPIHLAVILAVKKMLA